MGDDIFPVIEDLGGHIMFRGKEYFSAKQVVGELITENEKLTKENEKLEKIIESFTLVRNFLFDGRL